MTHDDDTDHCPVSGSAHHGYITDKDKYLKRLERIEGQARGISRMIEEERYCIDILAQTDALTNALGGVALALLDDHLRHCVLDAAAVGGPAADTKLTEASEAIARLVWS
ncbi:metal-sensitive transcriptional regulator [Mycolicibacterium goodii]|uniref:metal-sensitive transcriptional regulator n=1 Tax=Mycolicibacterium goodii TaxID=134601 RepID=UPI001BDD8246|nr:metal-sensitive transcriptional regulator [Mycolicibacterium goodii]MBU8811717.1 metal-sensitive transcriptional regulator [Mycolicibacterium goodii]MBU8828735.1 metal-sensitive transcriptional regulator [Mycolicibacterium goodii]ULN44875.1 metal-sensitive transcriptional regulator [Mycolicibacterium goodii]